MINILNERKTELIKWFNYNNINDISFVTENVDINKFNFVIENYTKYGRRNQIQREVNRIKYNKELLPIIVDSNYNVLEGSYQLVAQKLLNENIVKVLKYNESIEFLQEISLDKTIDIVKREDGDYKAEFESKGINYVIDITHKAISVPNSYEVSFRFKPKIDSSKPIDFDAIMNALRTNPYSNTGKQDQFNVYSMVLSTIKKFIDDYNPNLLYIGTKDKQRFDVYERLVKKFMGYIPDYDVKHGNFIEDNYMFILYRKDLPKNSDAYKAPND